MYRIVDKSTREEVYSSVSFRDCQAILEDKLQNNIGKYEITDGEEPDDSPRSVVKVTLFKREEGEQKERVRFVQMFSDPEQARLKAETLFAALKAEHILNPQVQEAARRVNGDNISGKVDTCVLSPKKACVSCPVADFCGTLVPAERLCGSKYFTPEQYRQYRNGVNL